VFSLSKSISFCFFAIIIATRTLPKATSLFTTTMAFFGAEMNSSSSSTDQQTYFSFYCNHENRPYFYEPMSGDTTWILPPDGILSNLPGAPVDRPPPTTVIYHRPQQQQQQQQPISPSSANSSHSTTDGDEQEHEARAKQTDDEIAVTIAPPVKSYDGIYQILIAVLCVSNLLAWGWLVGEPACWTGVRNTTARVLALDGIVLRPSKNAYGAASITNGWASLSSYSQDAYRTSHDNWNRRVRTVSTRMDESVNRAVMASTNHWESLQKQGSAWVEQTKGSFRNLGEAMRSSIESVQSQFEQLVPGTGRRGPSRHDSEEEVLHFSDDEIENDDEPNEISLGNNAEESSSGEILETMADFGEQKVDDTSLDLLDETNQNERGGDGLEDSSEASISFDEAVSEHEVVLVENMDPIDPADDDNNNKSNEVPVDTVEREALFTAASEVIDEEDDSTTTEERPEQPIASETIEATTRPEIVIDLSDQHEIPVGLDLVPENDIGDSEALVEQSVVGDINKSTKSGSDQEFLSGETNEAADDSLDRNDHVAELDEVNSIDSDAFSRQIKESVAVDTSAEVAVDQQREDEEDQNVESSESSTEVLSKEEETPEGNEDDSPHSIQITVEPLALEPVVELEEPSTLERILLMATAAGVVIDPSVATSLGSIYMANRPPLLTAMCPGLPELRMLLSHCQK
jgi:hypothetical protein